IGLGGNALQPCSILHLFSPFGLNRSDVVIPQGRLRRRNTEFAYGRACATHTHATRNWHSSDARFLCNNKDDSVARLSSLVGGLSLHELLTTGTTPIWMQCRHVHLEPLQLLGFRLVRLGCGASVSCSPPCRPPFATPCTLLSC